MNVEYTPSYMGNSEAHVAEYMREIFAIPDTRDDLVQAPDGVPVDKPEVQIALLDEKIRRVALHRERLLGVLDMAVNDERFRWFEATLGEHVKMIDTQSIWKAMDEMKPELVATLRIVRAGIMSFFGQFDGLKTEVRRCEEKVQEYKNQINDIRDMESN